MIKEIFINQSNDFTDIVDSLTYSQKVYLIRLIHTN